MEMKIVLSADEKTLQIFNQLAGAIRALVKSNSTGSCRCDKEDQITDARHAEELAEDAQGVDDAKAKKAAEAEAKAKKAAEAKAKKAAEAKKKRQPSDEAPSDVSAQKLKRDLIAPLQEDTFANKDDFRKYIEAHIRPMLVKEFEAESFLGVKKGMMAACYVRTKEVIAETLNDFVKNIYDDEAVI